MECDNNNDFDIASVKALDNKLCSEVCLPGEWQSADHELGGRRSPTHTPARTPGHLSPALLAPVTGHGLCYDAGNPLRKGSEEASGQSLSPVLQGQLRTGGEERFFLSLRPGQTGPLHTALQILWQAAWPFPSAGRLRQTGPSPGRCWEEPEHPQLPGGPCLVSIREDLESQHLVGERTAL